MNISCVQNEFINFNKEAGRSQETLFRPVHSRNIVVFFLGFSQHYHKSVLQKQRTSSLSVMCSDLSIPEMYDNYHNGLAGGGNNVDVFEFNEDDSEEN